jgi:hypothetical protein
VREHGRRTVQRCMLINNAQARIELRMENATLGFRAGGPGFRQSFYEWGVCSQVDVQKKRIWVMVGVLPASRGFGLPLIAEPLGAETGSMVARSAIAVGDQPLKPSLASATRSSLASIIGQVDVPEKARVVLLSAVVR